MFFAAGILGGCGVNLKYGKRDGRQRGYEIACVSFQALTIRSTAQILQSVLGFLRGKGIHDDGGITRDAMLPETLPRAIDTFDIKRILAGINGGRNRVMILLLLRAGMRIGELLNTTITELNLEERKIFVYEGEKNELGRATLVATPAMSSLRGSRREIPPRYFFSMHRAGIPCLWWGPYDVCTVSQDGRGYTLHCLRHTCSTDLLNAGMRLECLQQLLGHHSIEITCRYARLSDKTREEEYFRAMTIIEKETEQWI